MRAGPALRLTLQSVRRARRSFVLSVFGIAVGIAALSFFAALSQGVRRRVLQRIFPPGRLEVVPPRSSLGVLGELLGPRPIDEETVRRVRALPGVRSVQPRMRVAFPVRGWGGEGLLGRRIYSELIVDGIDPAAVTTETAPLAFRDHWGTPGTFCTEDANCQEPAYCAWDINRCELPVPVVISPTLVEVYNGTVARLHGLPRLGSVLARQLRGFTFTAELGRSFVAREAQTGQPRQRRLMLVGISDRAIPIGVTVPLPYVRRWNAEYAGERAASQYTSLSIEVAEGGSVTQVADAVRKAGLAIEDNGAEQAGLAVTLLTAVLLLVSLAIVVVATVNIAHTFFRAVVERRRELGVLRAVGASGRDVQVLVLMEAALVGLCGAAAGLLTAWVAARAVDWVSRRYLPDFPFKPDTYFHFSPWLCLGAVLFSLLACLLGAYLPARAAARMSPAQCLSAT
ncbi:MAG: FtsX-like permease family protein [Myxococcales bacterium]|nr:FtsX-like permease family protein [Myxococcota bacterium]MDW8283571.1 FtsX-like permease family protein [Myxococcales bacterium]